MGILEIQKQRKLVDVYTHIYQITVFDTSRRECWMIRIEKELSAGLTFDGEAR